MPLARPFQTQHISNTHTKMTNDMIQTAPAVTKTTALSKQEKFTELAAKMDELAEAAQGAFAIKGNFARTIALGQAMANLREALTDGVMASIMKLKNTQLGFRTDERPASKYAPEIHYGVEVVRDAVIQACVLGLQCVGNHFNLLASRFYVTKEGFTYLLRNLPGLSDLMLTFHPAEIRQSSTDFVNREGERKQKIEREGITMVDMSWKWHGEPASKTLKFCIRVNDGMSQDALMGKAERKARKWLYEYLTNNIVADADVNDTEEIRDVTPNRSADAAGSSKPKAARMAAAPAPAPAKPEPEVIDVQSTKDNVQIDNSAAPQVPENDTPAGDEEEQAAAALDWVQSAMRQSGKRWQHVYEVCEACGLPHPEQGAARGVMARFALSVFRDARLRERMVQAGFIF